MRAALRSGGCIGIRTDKPMTKSSVDAKNIINTIAELFPQCFVEDRCEPHKPLKLGIDRELVVLGILTEAEARPVFRCYCQRLMYQRALAAGGPRYGLDGEPCGAVTAEQMAGARGAVAAIEARRAEKAKQMMLARRTARIATKAPSTPATPTGTPPKPTNPTRLGLADLKATWRARQEAAE
jgi:ProP effector